jgi:hypothetical protein
LRNLPVVVALSLLAAVPRAEAADACATAFASWVKLSEARVRKQKGVDGTKAGQTQAVSGACINGEAQRKELLRALAGVLAKCVGPAEPDPATHQLRELIGINQGFVAGLALCPPEARPEPAPEIPPAPAAPPAQARECLEIARVAPNRYVLANRGCSGTRVLAIVETRATSGETRCKAHTVDKTATIAAPADTRPQLNYECALSEQRCTRQRLAAMFPECDW